MWNYYYYYVYIITNHRKDILYIGVTNDLERRLEEHKANAGSSKSFAGKYYCHYLIYYERHSQIEYAIEREKQSKTWSKGKKEVLLNEFNAEWKFLNSEVKRD